MVASIILQKLDISTYVVRNASLKSEVLGLKKLKEPWQAWQFNMTQCLAVQILFCALTCKLSFNVCYQLVLDKDTKQQLTRPSCFSDSRLERRQLECDVIPSSEFQPLRWIKHTPLKCCILSQSHSKLTLKSLPFQGKQTEKQYEIWTEAMDTWLGWKNTTWRRTTRQDKTWLVFRTETDSIF